MSDLSCVVLCAVCVVVCRLQSYARLLKKNFPTIDAVAHLSAGFIVLFQMTVSPTHSIDAAGLTKAMVELAVVGAPKVLLVFVVPPDIYPRFAANQADVAQLPANVYLQVWEIPLAVGAATAASAAAASSFSSAAAASAASTAASSSTSKRKVRHRCGRTGCAADGGSRRIAHALSLSRLCSLSLRWTDREPQQG
jgi:hypothetical protein